MSFITDRLELVEQKQDQVLTRLARLERKVKRMSAAIDNLGAKIQKLSDASDGMTLVLKTLAAEFRNSAEDAAAIKALADKVDAKADQIVADTLANTPAAPAPPTP